MLEAERALVWHNYKLESRAAAVADILAVAVNFPDLNQSKNHQTDLKGIAVGPFYKSIHLLLGGPWSFVEDIDISTSEVPFEETHQKVGYTCTVVDVDSLLEPPFVAFH